MYSLNKITTVADCNVLLTWAQKEKSDLAHKHYTIERLAVNFGTTSAEIEAILQGVNIELTANQSVFPTLPEGQTKEEMEKKIKKTRLQKILVGRPKRKLWNHSLT
jgi:hypothetical protein